MTDGRFDLCGVARVTPEETAERFSRRAGAAQLRRGPVPAALLRQRLPLAGRLFEGLKRAARPLVRLLYLCPLLALLNLVLRWAGLPAGWTILVFVVLVVLLFAVLASLLLLFPFVGPRSQRRPLAALAAPTARRFAAAAAALGAPSPLAALRVVSGRTAGALRLRGRIVGEPGRAAGPLLCDSWLQRGGDEPAVRAFVGRHFALLSDGQPPVVVELDGLPWIFGDRRPLDARAAAELAPLVAPLATAFADELQVPAEVLLREAASLAIAEGQQVELVAAACEVLRDASELLLDGRPSALGGAAASGPYRREGGTPCVLVRCAVDAPVLLRPVA